LLKIAPRASTIAPLLLLASAILRVLAKARGNILQLQHRLLAPTTVMLPSASSKDTVI
jgi:hypothetical protein